MLLLNSSCYASHGTAGASGGVYSLKSHDLSVQLLTELDPERSREIDDCGHVARQVDATGRLVVLLGNLVEAEVVGGNMGLKRRQEHVGIEETTAQGLSGGRYRHTFLNAGW